MQGSSKKILIVDDDPMILSTCCGDLLGQEYCLAEASSGEEALAMLADFVRRPGHARHHDARHRRLRDLPPHPLRSLRPGDPGGHGLGKVVARASRFGPMPRGPTTTW